MNIIRWYQQNSHELEKLYQNYMRTKHIQKESRVFCQTDEEFLPFAQFCSFIYVCLFKNLNTSLVKKYQRVLQNQKEDLWKPD